MKKARKTRKRIPLTKRGAEQFEVFLEDLRGIVWNSTRDANMNWAQIAVMANITAETVAKFAYHEVKRPQFRTVFGIAAAVGARLTLSPFGD